MATPMLKLDLGPTYGAALVGTMIALVLYGITTLQTYLYYMYYPKDRWNFKALVACIWVLDTLQIAFCCRMIYIYLIEDFSQPISLVFGVWPLYASLICNIIIATLVQIFFTVRVHMLATKWWLTTLISLLIAAHLAFGIETVFKFIKINEFGKLSSITWSVAFPFALMAAIPDIIITSSMCWFLQTGKGDFRGTNALINQLMIYAINRALLTAIAAILELVLFATMPTKFYFLAVDACIGKLYANSLLATLNSRRSLRGRGFDSETQGSSLPSSANSRSAYMPDFRSNPDARSANANGDIPVPLSNLKASLSWTDRTTSDKVSTDSGSGSAFPPAHGYRDKEQYQGVVDIAVPPMNDRDGRPHPFSIGSGNEIGTLSSH